MSNSGKTYLEIIPAHISGYDLYVISLYAKPNGMGYTLWRAGWDLTEEEDYIHGYAT